MSIALALTTLGRSNSLGMCPIARSIFSFTSMKMRSMRLPGSNSMKMVPASIRDSLWMSFRPATCINCPLSGATTWPSTSRADAPGHDTCTVICGMSMSGISDTGIYLKEMQPMATSAIRHIVTAMGRRIKLRTIMRVLPFVLAYSALRSPRRGITSVPSARFRLPEVMTTSPSWISVSFRLLPVTAYELMLE